MNAITILSTDTVTHLEMSLRNLRKFVATDAKYAHPKSTIRDVLAQIDESLRKIDQDKTEFSKYKGAIQLALLK